MDEIGEEVEDEEFEFDDLPFDFESLLVDKPDDEVICKICYDLILKPISLSPCGHTFCQECVNTNNFTFCPYCNRPTTSTKANRLFKSNSIDKLMMRCRYNCGVIFPLEEREAHEVECEMAPVKCENNCNKEGLTRKTIKDHMEECTHTKHVCECGKTIIAQDIAQHHKEECDAVKECPYCKSKFKQKDMHAHNENCHKRKVEMIRKMFPQVTVEYIENVVTSHDGKLDDVIKEMKSMYTPVGTCIEVYNLTKSVREKHLQELVMHICPAVNLNFDWSFSDGTWCWIHLKSEEGAQLLQSTLQAHGFPFVRPPIKESLWLGRIDHLTFCPPLSTVDCPVHEFPTIYCPFKHNISKNGECIRWKAGQLCEKPTVCKFGHPGKTVVDLKFTKRIPNICKFCQKGSHFGWECPERTFANEGQGLTLNDTVGGVVNTLENILISERGSMLANRAGIALRRANPATAAVLQEQFGGKLKKLLEAYPNKFALINQEQPGLAMIQLINKPSRPMVSPIGNFTSLSSGSLFNPISSKAPRRIPLLGREWALESELLPFVHNTMKPHFEKIKNNIKTDKRLLPDLQVLCQHLHTFDKNSYVSNLKTCMRSVAEGIANIQLREYEPNFDQTVPYIDFKEKIKKIQNYNPNLSKALHFVRKLANEGSKTTVPGSNMILNEHDSLAEMFNRLTEALGIFFKSSSDSTLQKSRFSPGPTTVDHFYQSPLTSLGSSPTLGSTPPQYQHFPSSPPRSSSPNVPMAIQNQYQNFLNSTSPVQQNSFAFPTSLTPVQLYQSSLSSSQMQQYQNFPNNLQNKFNPSSSSNFNSSSSSSITSDTNSPLGITRYGSPHPFGFDFNNESNGKSSYTNSPNTPFHNFKPFFPANTNLAEKVCLNCGAINSHTSAQCRGCGWCGRTNHVVDQCTSKLPRCGYCSKQQNKGLGHKTCDCRYLLSSGKGI